MDYNFERNRINKFIKFYNQTNKKLKKLGGSVKEIISLNQDLQNDNNYLTNLVPALSMPTYLPQPIMSYDYITTDPNLNTDLYNKPFAPHTSVPASSGPTVPMSSAPVMGSSIPPAAMSTAAMSTRPAAMSTAAMSTAAMSTSVVGDTSSITISEPTGTFDDADGFKYLKLQKVYEIAIKEFEIAIKELVEQNAKLKVENNILKEKINNNAKLIEEK